MAKICRMSVYSTSIFAYSLVSYGAIVALNVILDQEENKHFISKMKTTFRFRKDTQSIVLRSVLYCTVLYITHIPCFVLSFLLCPLEHYQDL